MEKAKYCTSIAQDVNVREGIGGWLQKVLVLFGVTFKMMELFSVRTLEARTQWTWMFFEDG